MADGADPPFSEEQMKALEPILEQMVERRLKEQESGGALTGRESGSGRTEPGSTERDNTPGTSKSNA